jgi:ribosomal protein S18 acetylase RimI-like enzyme
MGVATIAPEVRCRESSPADRSYVIELAAEIFADFGDYRSILSQWLDTPRVTTRIALEGAQRRGFTLIARHQPLGFFRRASAELVAIALEDSARGRGLGRRLLEDAERIARAWDAHEMRLHTAETNRVARSFFARAGYERRERGTTRYPNGQTALELRRALV